MAILNIEIPQIMSGVINVVAKYSQEKDSDAFINDMRGPAIKLVAMYVGQVGIVLRESFYSVIIVI